MTRAAASVNYRALLFHQAVMVAMRLIIYRKLVEIIIIDGLRQDVLYGTDEASYTDPSGCGKDTSCNIEVNETNLPGLSRIMRPDSTTKLKDVTAIFPSITFASWASIFTGKMPNETGVMGNEYYVRDRDNLNIDNGKITDWMREYGYEEGMIKLDIETKSFVFRHNIPVEFGSIETLTDKREHSAPGNAIRNVNTVWSDVGEILKDGFRYDRTQTSRCDRTEKECRTVAIFNHYARGADWWGTASLSLANLGDLTGSIWKGEFTPLMDQAPANEAAKFINDYLERPNEAGERKRFPALFSVYFSALDHEAHMEGMGAYRDFMKNVTDPEVQKIIAALKDAGEFDNKIFIVVADHGHTAMPTDLPQIPDEDGHLHDANTSCEQITKDFDKDEIKYPELANNNLHIWELGEVMKAVGSIQNTVVRNKYRILAPSEIEQVFLNQSVPIEYRPTSSADSADIVAAFNGPMAHIYSRVGTDSKTLGEMAELFRLIFSYYPDEAHWLGFADFDDYIEFQAETVNRLWNAIDKILIRKSDGQYYIFSGLHSNGDPITDSLSSLTGNEYIEAELRINGMNDKNRSGDIVLVMKDKSSGDAVERYTTGVACKSWHGSLNPSDSYVPLIVSYPGGNRIEIEGFMNNMTPCPDGQCKGNWNVSDIIKEIINGQYQ